MGYFLLFGLGIGLLFGGAEGLVRGASNLARALRVHPIILGLTVVALSTSMPELVVCVAAVLHRSGDIALGNIVGSNVTNIGLILGLSAVIRPMAIARKTLFRDMPILVVTAIGLFLMALDQKVQRVDGVLLLLGMAAFVVFIWHRSAVERVKLRFLGNPSSAAGRALAGQALAPLAGQAGRAGGQALVEQIPYPLAVYPRLRVRDILLVILGGVGLAIGSKWVIQSAIVLAQMYKMSKWTIGVSLVAIGTSLPELATSLVAVWRREMDICVGNVVGSNILNVLVVLGLVAAFQPQPVPPSTLRFEFPALIAFSLILWGLMATGSRLSRLEGFLFLGAYAAFLVHLF